MRGSGLGRLFGLVLPWGRWAGPFSDFLGAGFLLDLREDHPATLTALSRGPIEPFGAQSIHFHLQIQWIPASKHSFRIRNPVDSGSEMNAFGHNPLDSGLESTGF
jgi:hypothetical protein